MVISCVPCVTHYLNSPSITHSSSNRCPLRPYSPFPCSRYNTFFCIPAYWFGSISQNARLFYLHFYSLNPSALHSAFYFSRLVFSFPFFIVRLSRDTLGLCMRQKLRSNAVLYPSVLLFQHPHSTHPPLHTPLSPTRSHPLLIFHETRQLRSRGSVLHPCISPPFYLYTYPTTSVSLTPVQPLIHSTIQLANDIKKHFYNKKDQVLFTSVVCCRSFDLHLSPLLPTPPTLADGDPAGCLSSLVVCAGSVIRFHARLPLVIFTPS